MGSCVGVQSPQLLRVFFLVTIFTIRNLWSWPECVWHSQATWGSSPVTKRNVLRALNHRQSQEGGTFLQCGAEVRVILFKTVSLCVCNTSETDLHMKSLNLLIHNLKKFCPRFWLMELVMLPSFSIFSSFLYFCSCWWWGTWHCFIYFSINSFFTKYTCFLSYFLLLFQKLGRRENWKDDLVPFLSAIINLKIHSPVHHRAMIHPEVPCNQCKFNWILHLF